MDGINNFFIEATEKFDKINFDNVTEKIRYVDMFLNAIQKRFDKKLIMKLASNIKLNFILNNHVLIIDEKLDNDCQIRTDFIGRNLKFYYFKSTSINCENISDINIALTKMGIFIYYDYVNV
jgi:hypothetical protein